MEPSTATTGVQVGVAAIQGGVISAVALYLGFKLPAMIRDWNKAKKEMLELTNNATAEARRFYAEEYIKFREMHREDMKFLAESVCKYNQGK